MKFEFEAIGTHWQIDINEEISAEKSAKVLEKIKNRIDIFDKNYSRFRDDSLVMRMSHEAGEFELPEDADEMISLYKKMSDVTHGLVTPLIGKVMEDAGYDAKYSLVEKTLTAPKRWEEVLKWENPRLTLLEPALLDFGACGKGYLVDIVSEILEEGLSADEAGIKSYCVDAGGDMRSRSLSGELRVGLENPLNTGEVVGVVKISNQSLCGSAGNRRAWGNFHHIINPKTLTSPREILAVWCTASTTILADMMTTGLFFVSPETLLKHFKFEYFILYPDFSIKKSDGFDAELFS